METPAANDTANAEAPPEPAKLDPEAVAWAFRMLIGRAPYNTEEIEAHRSLPDVDTLRRAFSHTWEFFDFFDSMLDGKPTYGMPLFLMRPPADPAIPWKFEPPSLEDPVCQFCTMSQFDDAAFTEIAGAMGMAPVRSRRSWEQVFIVSTLATAGLIGTGMRGLGFGVGRERIPALLASRGVKVVASDSPERNKEVDLPPGADRMALFYPEVLHLEDFQSLVEYRPIDMNMVPADLDGQFDFCWSASALDRLGSLTRATDFIEASLRTLRPGGMAVHTFEFNIRTDVATVDAPTLAILRRRDIEALVTQLQTDGHEILPLNFHPGSDPLDEEVFVKPGGPPRPKQRHGALVVTSFGFAVRKAA